MPQVDRVREAARVVRLGNAEVRQGRFEELAPEFQRAVDVILIRGVRITAELSEALRSSLRRNGKLFAFGASPEIEALGWRLLEQKKFSVSNGLAIFDPDR